MKALSLELIQNTIYDLNEQRNNVCWANELIENLKKVIRIETRGVGKSKFDIFHYVAKDEMRPAMCGVFHDNGYRVASNAQVLVAVKSDYPEDFEGCIEGKDGSVKPATEITKYGYPKWRAIIPDEADTAPATISTEKIREGIKEAKAAMAAEPGRWSSIAFEVKYLNAKGEECKTYFPDTNAKLLAEFMDHAGSNTLSMVLKSWQSSSHMGVCYQGEHRMLAMARMMPEPELVYIVNINA